MRPITRAGLLPALALLAALAGCSAQEQNQFKINSDLEQAQDYAQINNDAKARYWADQAVSVDPGSIDAYVSDSQSGPPDAPSSIAQLFRDTGDEPALRDYMKQAAAKFPNDYRPLFSLDQAYGMLGDLPDQQATARDLAALLEKKIGVPGAHDQALTLALAQAYCDAGNLTKGAQDYQSVIGADPTNMDAYNGLAYAYAVADSAPNLPQARALAQKAVALASHLTPTNGLTQEEIDGEVAACQDTLGWVQYRQGDFQDALSNIQAAVDMTPRTAEERYHLGAVYEALHQPEAARAELQHATLLAQGYADAQRELSRLGQSSEAPPPQ